MIDTQTLKAAVNLVRLIEADLGSGKRSGRWTLWKCPFHPDKTPSLAATEDNGHWYCFGCHRSGDAIAWMMEFRQLSFNEACEQLGGNAFSQMRATDAKIKLPIPVKPPPTSYQSRACEFVERAHGILSHDSKAQEYLRRRGLTVESIERWQLGYNPSSYNDDAAIWGADPAQYPKGIWLPQGWVIPCIANGHIWYVKVRRPADDIGDRRGRVGSPKYANIAGSKANTLYGVDHLRGDGRPLLLVEGEFNAMIAYQTLHGRVDVASVGSASNGIAPRWRPYLLPYPMILGLYDEDAAGQRGARALASSLPTFRQVWLPSGVGDLNDFAIHGGDLNTWLSFHLSRLEASTSTVESRLTLARDEMLQQRQARWAAYARDTGELYWTLHSICEMNNTLKELNERLEQLRQSAEEHGVLDVLEQTLADAAPEGMHVPR